MLSWERCKVVLLEKVVHAHPQELRDETNVVAVVEPLQEVYTFANGDWSQLSMTCMLSTETAYLLFFGSRSLSFCRTRTSILLASRYFGIARIILMATRLFVSMSTASTTLPNVPWPNSRTVRSEGMS